MKGIKNFILGFSLSLFSVSLYGQLSLFAPAKPKDTHIKHINIELFKKNISQNNFSSKALFSQIKKETFVTETLQDTQTAFVSPDGFEDDEILSINNDEIIPIEFSNPVTNTESAEVVFDNHEEKTAMLPESLREDETFDNPWILTKGRSSIKNKQLLEKLSQQKDSKFFTNNLQQISKIDENLSYKVAEKIKQSIIFPIPDEILNDENLTPTFIRSKKKTAKAPSQISTSTAKKDKIQPLPVENKIEVKKTSKSESKEANSSILNSLSSWFSDKPAQTTETKQAVAAKKRTPPSYNSQDNKSNIKEPKNTSNDLANFYESLQKTKKDYNQRKILPSELKLSFQPGRAEISGTTLHWLKVFSEATLDNKTYLQIRLDASAPTNLQKKRLNLLYTIFMNNGVDFKKVDTVFSLTESNTFIIRAVRLK